MGKISWKSFIAIIICGLLFASGAFAVKNLFSLHGKANLTSGDVRVFVYDANTGGTLVYDSVNDYNGAIRADGTFDVVVGDRTTLDLNYGQYYFYGLRINSSDLNFGSHDRARFESNRGENIIVNNIFSRDANALNLKTSNTTRLTITADGNVGIGTSAPSVKLHVSNGVDLNTTLVTSDRIVISDENSAPGFSIIAAASLAAQRAVFKGVRARGSLTTPTVPQLNDDVLTFLGAIYDGNSTEATAAVTFIVDGSVSDAVAPQRIGFLTSATNSANRTERLTIKNDGNVGIGTTVPRQTLNVKGDLNVTGLVCNDANCYSLYDLNKFSDSSSTSVSSTVFNAAWPVADANVVNNLTIITTNDANFDANVAFGGIEFRFPRVYGTSNQVLTTDAVGNLSWTTITAAASGSILAADVNAGVFGFNQGQTGTYLFANDLNVNGNLVTNNILSRDNNALNFQTNNTNRLVIGADGNVGINSASPSSLFQVAGTTNANALVVNLSNNFVGVGKKNPTTALDVNGSTTISGNVTVDTRFVINSDGNIGMGTANPKNKVNIVGDLNVIGNFNGLALTVTSGGQQALAVDKNGTVIVGKFNLDDNGATPLFAINKRPSLILLDNSTTVGSWGQLTLGTDSNASQTKDALITSIPYNATNGVVMMHARNTSSTSQLDIGNDPVFQSASVVTSIGFHTNTAIGTFGNTFQRMTIVGDGNIGINTSVPASKLDVNGNAKIRIGGAANAAVCWKADGVTLGYCSSVVAVDGTCTCN